MARARVEYKAGAWRQILRSDRVASELVARARRVAAAADLAANDPGGHEVLTELRPIAARAAVITRTPKSMWKEAVEHSLTRSFGNGRG